MTSTHDILDDTFRGFEELRGLFPEIPRNCTRVLITVEPDGISISCEFFPEVINTGVQTR